MDALLRYPYYCTKDVTSIYYNEDGVLSISYFYTWYAGGSPPSKYDSVNVDWHTGKEISLPEFLNMSNEETRELVAEKVLEHKENHPELDWGSPADFLKERDAEEFEKMKFYVWEEEVWVLFDGGEMMVSINDPIKIRIR